MIGGDEAWYGARETAMERGDRWKRVKEGDVERLNERRKCNGDSFGSVWTERRLSCLESRINNE